MALQSNSLCTLEDIRLRLNDPLMSAAHSGSYEVHINEASDFAEDYCNRTFYSGSIEVEIFDGLGYASNMPAYHTSHTLNQAPISRVPTLKLYNWGGSSWNLVDASTYASGSIDGTVYFPGVSDADYSTQLGYVNTTGPYFIQGVGNYKAEYWYGYIDVNDLPKDLRGIVAAHAIWLHNTTKLLGTLSNSSADDRAYTYDPSMPKRITNVYNRYIR